jgi:hypothetical protein
MGSHSLKLLKNPAVGKVLKFGGPAAMAGFAIKDVIEAENKVQASLQAYGSLGLGIAAGEVIGGAVGTAVPIPLVGTVAGVAAGGAVGWAAHHLLGLAHAQMLVDLERWQDLLGIGAVGQNTAAKEMAALAAETAAARHAAGL